MANEAIRERLTSGYTLVIHQVNQNSVTVWVGALQSSMAMPHNWRIQVGKVNQGFAVESENVQGGVVKTFGKDDWQRPFDGLNKRFYKVVEIDGLDSAQDYQVELETRHDNQWKRLEIGFFSTLPDELPQGPNQAFTVGIGSCFYPKHDGGQVGMAYEALYKNDRYRPDIKFLAGDQVYTDIGLGWYPLDAEDCKERVSDHYAESWNLMRSMLRRGGTWMIPDDHEYWNNYPFLEGFNPYLVTLDASDGFRTRWESACKEGVYNIQMVETVRTFDIGNDLSFCVADLRTERSKAHFVSPQNFAKIISWLEGLQSPGVLVIPQPLLAGYGSFKTDNNLPDWDQYTELLQKMQEIEHDIVVLTGDVHYGRVSEVMIGNSNNKLVEVITSPMSNLSELNGLAAATPDTKAKSFPLVDVDGVPAKPVKYRGVVTTESKWWDLRFPRERTREHFMTVDFFRQNGQIRMKVHAWNAREMDKARKLPKPIRKFNIAPITLK